MNSAALTGDERPFDTSLAWDALIADPATGVTVIADNGVVLFANAQYLAMYFGGDDRRRIVGVNISDIFPAPDVEERRAIVDRIAASGVPIILRHIRRGVQLQSTMQPFGPDAQGPRRILVVSHRGEHPPINDEVEIVESQFVHLGPLAVLSTRELEVLATMRSGSTSAEIGRRLGRSSRTIDNHLISIRQKLRLASRVELATVANLAALEPRDALLTRI